MFKLHITARRFSFANIAMFSKFQCFIFALLSPLVLSLLATTHLLVTHVGPCDDASETLMTFDELTITTQTVDYSLSGVFNLTEDVENGWRVKARMQKCLDIRNVETCDLLNEFDLVVDGCCENNEAEEETYGMLFHFVAPQMECPIRAGVYKLDNYPFFTEDNFLTVYETKISTSVFGYTFNMDGYTVDGRRFFCMEAYLQLLYMREHNWLSAHNKSQLNKYKHEDQARRTSSTE